MLGAVAVWLIVTSGTSPKRLELGILAGLWGALLGAFTLFGARRPVGVHDDAELDEARDARDRAERAWRERELADARDARDRAERESAQARTAEIELRSSTKLERAAEAEQRREFQTNLQSMLQGEMSHIRDVVSGAVTEAVSGAVSGEVASLRSEVASLRAELLEKVGGQLRLERIETTRVIGSDLEALQHEVRALKSANMIGDTVPADVATARRTVVEPARVRPMSRESAEVEADVQPAVAPTQSTDEQPAPRPVPDPPGRPTPEPRPAAAEQGPTPNGAEPFAALPRITPFTAFELDPVETAPAPSPYSGRRRRTDDGDAQNGARPGRHAGQEQTSADAPAPGRRRAAEPEEAIGRHGTDSAAEANGRGRHGAGRHSDNDATGAGSDLGLRNWSFSRRADR